MDKTSITRAFGRTILFVKSNAPAILTGVGVTGLVATAVVASKETLRLEPIIGIAAGYKHNADESLESGIFDREAYVKEIATIYSHTAVDLVRLYAPAIAIGSVSIAAILASHRIHVHREAGLVAAYTAANEAYSRYRGEVRTELGEEKELEIFNRSQTEVKTVTEIDPETGEEVSVEKRVAAKYIAVFDRNSPYFRHDDDDANLTKVRIVQNFANDRLTINGHVFLNEIYDDLGLPRTKAGAVTGWIYDPNNLGDHQIQLGFDLDWRLVKPEGIDGFIINPNVQGVILDYVEA